MILRLTTPSRQLAICSAHTIVQVTPNLKGSKVTTSNGSFDVLETVEQVYSLWHDSCTNSTNITNITNIKPAQKNTTPNTTTSNSNNIGAAVVGDGKILIINQNPIPVAGNVKPSLYDYCKTNQPVLELLGYWMTQYETHMAGEYNLVSAVDLGTVAKIVRTDSIQKAKSVIDWVFTSDHYRAKWLRSKGMVNPAVIVSTKKLEDNYALTQVKALPPLPKSVKSRSASIPQFDYDDNGNLIGGE